MMGQERAVLAGGCFWGMQDLIRKLTGVEATRVGYTGGDVPNATYRNHGTHAEGIEILFDAEKMSYRRLLEYFFQIHDPTTLNRQGNDLGTSYRSAIYYASEAQNDCRCRCFGPVAWQGHHPGRTRRLFLGGGTRAPGLSGAITSRLHLSLSSPRLGAASTNAEEMTCV
jgi:peptide-methionine (S)-S-oxide reductase